jgi:hypothetical protein
VFIDRVVQKGTFAGHLSKKAVAELDFCFERLILVATNDTAVNSPQSTGKSKCGFHQKQPNEQESGNSLEFL